MELRACGSCIAAADSQNRMQACRVWSQRYVVMVTARGAAPTLPTAASLMKRLRGWRAAYESEGTVSEAQQRAAVGLFRDVRACVATGAHRPGACKAMLLIALQLQVSDLVADVATHVAPAATSPFEDAALALELAAAWKHLGKPARSALAQLLSERPVSRAL
jgi:hypothetical protein